MRRILTTIVLIVAALVAAAIGFWAFRASRQKVAEFIPVPVKRGDLVSTISATGTIEPEAAVDVGAQVAGIIIAFGTDKKGQPISWRSVVEAGEVLVRIDDSLYAAAVATAKAQLSQGEANVLASEANVRTSEANVLQQKANLLYAAQNWERAQKLGPSDALSERKTPPLAHIECTVRNRPPQAEAQLHGATAQIGVAVAQLFPQFSLTGGASFQAGLTRSLFAGPVVPWPIFQGGAIVSNIHAQQAIRDEAFITYQQAVLTAFEDVENALIAYDDEQEHNKSLRDAVAADRKSVGLNLRLFQEGQTNLLSVLTAESALCTDQNALTQSKENLAADLIALYKALGGG